MAIKLAFSTVACPEWSIQQVAEQARAMGYHGVELRTLARDVDDERRQSSIRLQSDPAVLDVEQVRRAFADHGVEPVMLSTSISLHPRRYDAGYAAQRRASEAIDMAASIGCRFVRVFVNRLEPGESGRSVLQRVAARLAPLGEKALDSGVELLIENAGSFSNAKPWWWLLNLLENPMVGLVWNPANAAAAGEPPSVSVPMLHSRIRVAKVKDVRVGEGSGFVPLGEGTVGIEQFVRRLLGIGFDSYVSVEWDRLWLPSLTPAEEYLPDAQTRLKAWLDQIEEAAKKGLGDASPVNKFNDPDALRKEKAKAAVKASKVEPEDKKKVAAKA